MDKIKLSYISALAICTGTTVILAWWWWSKEKKPKAPNTWRKVGEISDILVFPVKSLGFVRQAAVECTQLGCKSGWLRDRTLMVTDSNGKFVTARKLPRMVLIKPSVVGSILTFNAPGMMTINIDLANLVKKNFITEVWGQKVPACDCGEDIARWLSRFLLQEDTGLRLVFYPLDVPTRDIRSHSRTFPLMENSDTGAYPDSTAFSLMNEASLVDLNNRLESPVTSLQFRMNFIVRGAEPLEEDTWDWIKIGSVIFRNVRPCTRCIFTTIDPDLGIKNSKTEPLKTLKGYRQIEDSIIRSSVGDSPVMGIHLGLKGPKGVVKLGDLVYVGIPEPVATIQPISPP